MSQNTIQTKIEQIRNETQQYGNTRARVADLLTMLNTEKLDKAGVQGVVSEILNLAPEFLEYIKAGHFVIDADAGFGGTLVAADDPAPTKPTWYFAKESGTYPNAGGLVVDLTNKLVILSYDGTTWSKSEVEMQKGADGKTIEDWSAKPFGAGSQVFYNGKIYEASGAATSTDVPGTASVWVEKIVGLQNSYTDIENVNGVWSVGAGVNILGTLVSLPNYKCVYAHDATGIEKVILNIRTHLSEHGLPAVIGKKFDGTYVQIYDAVNTLLTNFEVSIPENTYAQLFVNSQETAQTESVVFVKNLGVKQLIPDDLVSDVEALKDSLNYFLGADVEEANNTIVIGGGYWNGSTIPVEEYNSYNVPTNAYKIKITGTTRRLDQAVPTVVAEKADGTAEVIRDIPSATLVDYEIEIPQPNTYKKIYVNLRTTTAVNIIYYTKVDVLDNVKEYIDSHSGGSGSSLNISNSVIFAETYGVSASATPAQNTSILNQIFSDNKNKGVTVFLPAGNIRIAGTLNIWDTTTLIGSGKGAEPNVNGGGTILEATQGVTMLNVQHQIDCHQGSAIKNIAFHGKNVASVGLYVGEGTAFFSYEELTFFNIGTAIHTVGALLYIMRNIRICGGNIGLKVERTYPYQANHIRFEMCQFSALKSLGCDISGGAQVVFEQCDWEQNGTTGNVNTGNMLISSMSPLGEGTDVTLNNCWSEYVSGGFWMKINNSVNGTTVIRDSMLWRLSGDAQKGIINNGSRLLITGSTKINDFTTDIETTNNGQTKVDGFVRVNTHVENTGGSYKTAAYS